MSTGICADSVKKEVVIATPFLIWIGYVSRVSSGEIAFLTVDQGGRSANVSD